MSDDKGYNGWSNYESWLVGLWLSNDQSSFDWCRHIVRHSKDLYAAGDEMKDFVDELNPLRDQATIFSDLLNAALSEVDWKDVAEQFCNDDVGAEGDEIE